VAMPPVDPTEGSTAPRPSFLPFHLNNLLPPVLLNNDDSQVYNLVNLDECQEDIWPVKNSDEILGWYLSEAK